MQGQWHVARADPDLASVAKELLARVPELAAQLTATIRARSDVYGAQAPVPADDLRESVAANLEFVFRALGGGEPFDTSQAWATGVARAAAGVPLPAVMEAYQVGSQFIWEVIISAARPHGLSDDRLVRAATDIWLVQDSITQDMAAGHRNETTTRILAHEQERSALVEGLLEGRLSGSASLWEVAEQLRISPRGWHVVVAADPPEVGRRALPGIEEILRAHQLASVWCLLPHLQLGIVDLDAPDRVDRLWALVDQHATGRVGISSAYDDLSQTARAVRFARIALHGSPPEHPGVTRFDASPLSIAAVSNPDVMQRVARTVLGALDDLPADDRSILLDTLDAWFNAGGSATETANRLYCHPNTVRHRLRRIEERTGRSLADPRALTELCIALETERRLPHGP